MCYKINLNYAVGACTNKEKSTGKPERMVSNILFYFTIIFATAIVDFPTF